MQSRHSGLPELWRDQIPVAAAACFFVSALLFSGAMAMSPRANAARAVESEYAWIYGEDAGGGKENAVSGEETRGEEITGDVGIPPLVLRDIPGEVEDKSKIRRISVKKVEVIPTDGGEGDERSFHYRVDYDLVLAKENQPETPVIADTAEGGILMERKGIFGWRAAEIQ
jgi:hypothetical protein